VFDRDERDAGTDPADPLSRPAINRAPIAVDVAVSTNEAVAVTLNVLANDSDPDGDPSCACRPGTATRLDLGRTPDRSGTRKSANAAAQKPKATKTNHTTKKNRKTTIKRAECAEKNPK